MYRLDRMRKQYEKHTKAEGYIIGFRYDNQVYAVELDKIPRKYTRIQKESHSNGGGYGLYVRVLEHITEILPKAKRVCAIEDLIDKEGHLNSKGQQVFYNKGVMFEKKIYEMNNQEFRGKDSVGFWKSGDITLDGKEIQIKFEWARICYDRTLQRLERA